ncbi:MAG TPA: hypothetical protein VI589_10660 [Vicinamibacteria bacterium]
MRRPMVLLAAFFLLVAGGGLTAGEEACEWDCPGDGPDGSCSLEYCCS